MTVDWFHAIADRLADPVLLLSPAGIVDASNPVARRALGRGVDGTDLTARVDAPDDFRRYLTLAARSGSPLPGGLSIDGAQLRWRCDASVTIVGGRPALVLQLRPSNETVRRFMALNQQIDRLNAEVRRRQLLERERESLLESERLARAAAEEASRFKDQLLTAVSHELRTPLQAIQGWLTLIRKSPGDLERLARGLNVIERNVAAEVKLTEDLVDVSLAISGRMKLDLQPVDLELVIRQAVDSALPAAEAKGQRIQVMANVGNCVINGDHARLLQVVWNLLANATRYTPKGGRIQIVLKRINSHAEISVSDTGEGIAPEVLPYIFDRFRRADGSSTRRQGGLGLGLSIARHLVELHGGFVIVESEGLGRGSTFTVNLPLPVFRAREATIAAPEGSHADAAGALAGIHILLVEDHKDSRELLETILLDEGARVTAVDSAASAREVFRKGALDIVVSDIEMPEEDGFTFLRKLRDLERELGRAPVSAIAVSAHTIGDARLHALRAGYHTFLSKPLMPDELVATIANLCRVRGAP